MYLLIVVRVNDASRLLLRTLQDILAALGDSGALHLGPRRQLVLLLGAADAFFVARVSCVDLVEGWHVGRPSLSRVRHLLLDGACRGTQFL
jgi:hypothetical protein